MTTLTITSTGQLEALSLTELANLYNGSNPPKQIKKFRDKASGVRRCLSLLAAQQASPEPAPPTMPQGVPPGLSNLLEGETTGLDTLNDLSGAPRGRRRKAFNTRPKSEVRNHRAGTRRARTLDMLLNGGATLEQVMETIGWTKRQAVEGIRLLHTHLGYGLEERENGLIFAINPS